jgi:CRISPR-associated protein Cmr1
MQFGDFVITRKDERIRETRHYELITPLFGGGVEPQQADPISSVRASSVRGQLRFWWRATRGGHYATLEQLAAAEAALWGSAASTDKGGQSLVLVEVVQTHAGRPFAPNGKASIGEPGSSFSYVAFPLNKTDNVALEGVQFKLRLSYPKDRTTDVAAALWAWETFGGIGGRTRRGFGSLRCLAVTQNGETIEVNQPKTNAPEQVLTWLKQGLHKHVVETWHLAKVPHIAADPEFVLFSSHANALRVWQELFAKLKNFRHQRPSGRMPGRNHWPEPDVIRRRTGRFANYRDKDGNLHDHRRPLLDPPIDAFPRAAFGLPIQFEFKRDDQQNGDPKDKNPLLPRRADKDENYNRFASPLILRPLACADGSFIGIAFRLAGSAVPDRLHIDLRGNKQARHQLTPEEAARIPELTTNQPLLRNPDGTITSDVITGFMNYLRRHGGS